MYISNIASAIKKMSMKNQKKKEELFSNQKLLKTKTFLIYNQLLQNIQKLHINYPRL